jgi:hypothetical protein
MPRVHLVNPRTKSFGVAVLLVNAIKFTPRGGRIDIALVAPETRAEIRITVKRIPIVHRPPPRRRCGLPQSVQVHGARVLVVDDEADAATPNKERSSTMLVSVA